MTNTFVEANLPQNSTTRTSEVLERLKANIEAKFGALWEPSSGDLEVILLEVLASLAGNVELTAATVLSAVFRRYGTKLLQLEYNEGAEATGSTTWTLSDAPATTIPSGTQLEAGGFGFATTEAVTITEGQTSATVPIAAVARGTEYNAVTGVASLLEPFTWVTEVRISGETTGGADQETDEEYEGRLITELELQAPRPITAVDYAKMVLGAPSRILPTGVVVGRATAIDGYNAETEEEEVERCVTTWVTDKEGKALTSEAMEALEKYLKKYREINFLPFVRAAVYKKVYVTYKIQPLAGYNGEALVAQADEALERYLSPFLYGNPNAAVNQAGKSEWATTGYEKIRYNVLLGLIERVKGVQYVPHGSEGLAIGFTASPTGTEDLTLTGGKVVLPEVSSATITGTVA